ncbi:MAG TPA: DUF1501 domain-containing protein [Planctomycetaceae bacterium]|jgi:hypothetical protein|nr:DUF1501 domain-containing protein [Planctomycetaceae bacterium]
MTPMVTNLQRRAFLGRTAGGILGSIAFRWLSATEAGPRSGAHHPARAERVVVLFQNGGPSQMDLFDPKPELSRRNGQPYPGGVKVETLSPAGSGNLLGSPFEFRPAGQSGMLLSELIPHIASIADDLTLVRSMTTESVCHETALRIAHSGHPIATDKPSFGSWLTYGLGSHNQNLPAFVVLPDPGGLPINGTLNWSAGWLPAQHQGTAFNAGDLTTAPVLNLRTPGRVPDGARRRQLDFLQRLNAEHRQRFPENTDLEARLQDFETAARMQATVPTAVDLTGETEATRQLYGLDQPATAPYGTRCLLARRLLEQGVRFVGVYLKGQPWDTHSDNANATKGVAAQLDQPSAALVKDLKQRGLLDSTLVVWMGEFGRTPVSQGANGRDHSRRGFSLWLAGGGVKGGYAHGNTDEFGYESVDRVVSMHDLHATMLHCLGLDHRRLTFEHDGRNETLTDSDLTHANVVTDLLT